jgi:predicted enzyme related to lactoylglutathione lyase
MRQSGLVHFDLMLDCNDLEVQAAFWSAALGFERVDDPDDPDVMLCHPTDRSLPRLWLQPVPEQKGGKNRLHLDLYAEDPEAEAERLVALGATRGERIVQPGTGSVWIVLFDPEGNELCSCQEPSGR